MVAEVSAYHRFFCTLLPQLSSIFCNPLGPCTHATHVTSASGCLQWLEDQTAWYKSSMTFCSGHLTQQLQLQLSRYNPSPTPPHPSSPTTPTLLLFTLHITTTPHLYTIASHPTNSAHSTCTCHDTLDRHSCLCADLCVANRHHHLLQVCTCIAWCLNLCHASICTHHTPCGHSCCRV